MTALIDGRIGTEVVFDPSPLDQITASVEGLAEASASGEIFAGIPAGRITCALGAFVDAGDMLVTIGSEAGASITAQTSFVTSMTTGDFGS